MGSCCCYLPSRFAHHLCQWKARRGVQYQEAKSAKNCKWAKQETLPSYREIVFGRFENQDSFTGLLTKGIAYSGGASPADVSRHAKANMLQKIPKRICSLVETYQRKQINVANNLNIAKVGDSTNGMSTTRLDLNSLKRKTHQGLFDKMNLFYLGRAFASLLDKDENGHGDQTNNWRISVVKYFFNLVEEEKELLREKYRKWHTTPVEEKLRHSFRTSPCIQKATGWWSYKYCYMKTAQQIHEDKSSHDKNVINNLGKFEKVDDAFFQRPIGPSPACETERKLGCLRFL